MLPFKNLKNIFKIYYFKNILQLIICERNISKEIVPKEITTAWLQITTHMVTRLSDKPPCLLSVPMKLRRFRFLPK